MRNFWIYFLLRFGMPILILVIALLYYLSPFILKGIILGGVVGACIGTCFGLYGRYYKFIKITPTPEEESELHTRIKAIEVETSRKVANVDEEIKQIIAGELTTTPVGKTVNRYQKETEQIRSLPEVKPSKSRWGEFVRDMVREIIENSFRQRRYRSYYD